RRQPSARPPPSCPAPLSYHAARPSSPPVYPSLQVRMGHDRARAPRECLEEREFPSCEPAPDPTKLRLARGGVSWGPVPARRTGRWEEHTSERTSPCHHRLRPLLCKKQ